MKPIHTRTFMLATMLLGNSWVFAAENCLPIPSALENVSVSYISEASELEKVDEQLERYVQACLAPSDSANMKSVCSNGRLVAEQTLRVIARIDEAGKHNAFLRKAKVKSYKLGVALMDKMKQLKANHTCP